MLVFIVLLNTINVIAQSHSWACIGANDTNCADYKSLYNVASIAVNDSQIVYAVSNDYGLRVRYLKNGLWKPFGGEIAYNNSTVDPSIALDKSGTQYIAFGDGKYGNKLSIIKYDGSAWVNVGKPGITPAGVSHTCLKIDNKGNLFVFYSDSSVGGRGTVMKFDGSKWDTLGKRGIVGRGTLKAPMTLDTSGKPVIVDNDTVSYVIEYDGKSWIKLNTVPIIGILNGIECTFNKANILHVAFINPDDLQLAVYRLNNFKTWDTLGFDLTDFGFGVENLGIVIDSSNIVYAGASGYTGGSGIGYTNIFKYKNSKWDTIPDPFLNLDIGKTSFATNTKRDCIFLNSNWYLPSVMRCYSDTILILEDNGIQKNWNNDAIIFLDKGNKVYALTQYYTPYYTAKNDSICLLKYVNNQWNKVFATAMPFWWTLNPVATTDGKGQPYVLWGYSDSAGAYPYLSTYYSGKWHNIDTTFLHQFPNYYSGCFYCDKNNQMHIYIYLFDGRSDTGFIIHLQYDTINGSKFINKIIIPNSKNYFDGVIAADSACNVYFAYYDSTINLMVQKYDTVLKKWNYVGNLHYKGDQYGSIISLVGLSLNKKGRPYIVYDKLQSTGFTSATVAYFNDSTWEFLGDTCFAATESYHNTMVISNTDTAYVCVNENKFYGETYVFMYPMGMISTNNTVFKYNEVKAGLAIYPNPTGGVISYIYNPQSNNQKALLELFDNTGRLIYSQNISLNSKTYKGDLTNLKLQSGLYLLRITDGSSSTSAKLIIQ